MKRMSQALAILLVVLPASCRWGSDRDEMRVARPPPAAAITPVGRSMPLPERLARLEAELAAAIRLIGTEAARERLLRAEAITDGLLEADLPFDWIEEDAYLVDARLRQIQALADHVIAMMRRGASGSTLLMDVRVLHREVARLRERVDRGRGGTPPTPIDSLLAGIGSRKPSAPAPAAAARDDAPRTLGEQPTDDAPEDEPRLLGEPVDAGRG